MRASIEHDSPSFVREATVTCGAWRWTAWLLACPEWRAKITDLASVGAQGHRSGLAFREQPAGGLIADAARFDRWHGRQRSLACFLPASLCDLVAWLALRPSLRVLTGPSLARLPRYGVVLPAGPPIARARMERAQAVALDRLRGHTQSRQERRRNAEAFRRFLAAIDPGRPPLLFIDALTSEHRWASVGSTVNTSATAAGDHGQFIACASRVGYPTLGRVATQAAGLAGVEPAKLPAALGGRFEVHAVGL
jgi:hypothetical protein